MNYILLIIALGIFNLRIFDAFPLTGTVKQTSPESIIVEAGILGPIKGSLAQTIGTQQRSYAKYVGIRYANQPTRFMPSELFEQPLSESTYDATQYGSECPQPTGSGSEDCLLLNIYTPRIANNATKKFPVLIWIHGAAFVSGNANAYTGSRLLNKDIVLVTFNYRLGSFGFFNLESNSAPGNPSLYDAITVLHWTKKFIQYFGGDTSSITLAGQSSGSASVSHLLLSPLTRGLFHRAIAASGSALDVWATARNPLAHSLQVAAYAGCYNPSDIELDKEAIINCMVNADQADIILAQNMFQYQDRKAGSIGFAAVSPSVQTFLEPEYAIIPHQPSDVLDSQTQNNVPLMMSVTRDDGGFALRLVVDGFLNPNELLNNTNFISNELVPMIFKAIGIPDHANTISNAFSSIYIDEEVKSTGNFSLMARSLMDMLGVLFFKSAAYRTIQHHSILNKDTYFLAFDYEGEYSQHPPNTFPDHGKVVAHADDLIYLFELTGPLNDQDQLLSDTMVDYWTNFMYTGNPNNGALPEWPAFSNSGKQYLIIDSNSIHIGNNYQDTWVIENRDEVHGINCPSKSSPKMFGNLLITFILIVSQFIYNLDK